MPAQLHEKVVYTRTFLARSGNMTLILAVQPKIFESGEQPGSLKSIIFSIPQSRGIEQTSFLKKKVRSFSHHNTVKDRIM